MERVTKYMEEKENKIVKQALIELFDSDDTKVMKALKTITKSGAANCISALMDLYVKVDDGPVKDELQKMLESMKLAGGDEELMALLKEPRFKDHQAFILTCIWNSGYQPIEHLDVIVEAGIKGDYMTTFEALTVIENLEPPFDMDALAVASLYVDDFLDERPHDERTGIIEQMKAVLDNYKAAMLTSEGEE